MLDDADRDVIRRRLERLAAAVTTTAAARVARDRAAAALVRLDGGAFGLCPRCLQEIERTRLLASPAERWCVDCESDAQSDAPCRPSA